jgi:hypothetical protein
MILFINGPFGVGKTSVARLLVQKLPRAVLYDPEVIGAFLHKFSGPFRKEDFQDYAPWRILLVGGARLLRIASPRTLVVPMTVYRRDLFDRIVAGLRRADPDLSCFRLTVPREVLLDRISSDTEDLGAYPWRTSHLEVSLRVSQDPAFGKGMPTEDRTPAEVADQILASLTSPFERSTN